MSKGRLASLPREAAKKVFYAINAPLIENRRRARSAMPAVKLEAIHVAQGKLLPSRLELLELMPKSATVAEIGVADGAFSADILEVAAPSRLHLIDAWHTERYSNDRQVVETRFSEQIEAGSVIVHPGLSLEVLARFEAGSFDWVYVDTNHSYETTAAELRESARVVKTGGRILGHDFCLGNIVKPAVFGVIPAVNEFCVQCGWQYEYLTLESHGYFSFCLRKIG